MAWRIRIQPPTQGMRVPSLLREDPARAANAEPTGPRALPCDKTRHQSEQPRHRSKEKSFLSSAQREEIPWAARKTQHRPLSLRRVQLCDHMDCSQPDSSVREILQVRILEWVALPSSRDLPHPGIEPRFPALQADSLPSEPRGKSNTAKIN